VIKVNLQRVVSIPGFIGCVHDAITNHPVKRVRRAAQRQIGVLEKEIGFDLKVLQPLARPTVAGTAAGPGGLVDQRDGMWYIVDPLFSEWLRRASPLVDRPR
jgi:hypothetical protein